MSGENQVLDFPTVKPDCKDIRPAGLIKGAPHKPAMVLDMGEASREEGFRLNGCR